MKIRYSHFILPAMLAVVVSSCVKEEPESKVTENFELSLSTNVDRLYEPGTRVSLYNLESDIQSKKLFLYGWNGDSPILSGSEVTYASGSWQCYPSAKLLKDESYTFYAYSETPSSETGISTPTVEKTGVSLEVTDITKAQEDILLGYCSVPAASSGDVSVNFSHPFASVIIQVGVVDNLQSISEVTLGGLTSSGETSLSSSSTTDGHDVTQYTWTNLGEATAKLEKKGLTAEEGDTAATFVVIPQNLGTDNSMLIVKYKKSDNSNGFLTKILDSDEWKAGYTTKYTIGAIAGVNVSVSATKSGSTLSGLTIQNTSESKVYMRATIAGAWYKDGAVVAPWEAAKGTFAGLPGDGWIKGDGEDIYYYSNPLEKNETANALFTSYTSTTAPVEGAALELSVLIQAIPYNVNKSCIDAFKAL